MTTAAMTNLETLELARAARAARAPDIHLFRGSPPVRSWSKHQETIRGWSLCGIHWDPKAERAATEEREAVTCEFCLQLLA